MYAYLGSESMLEKFCIHFCYLRLGLIEVANEVRLGQDTRLVINQLTNGYSRISAFSEYG